MVGREKMKLDIGCGNKKTEGCIGIDRMKTPVTDIVWDLEKRLPNRIKNDSIDIVYCNHILEHIWNLKGLMESIHRVCKDGAIVNITVPYYTSDIAFHDPTHIRFFTSKTFDYFDKSKQIFDYGFKCNFKVRKMSFQYYPWSLIIPFRGWFKERIHSMVHTMTVELEVVKP
jgi:SAM-dependent methyltransferase